MPTTPNPIRPVVTMMLSATVFLNGIGNAFLYAQRDVNEEAIERAKQRIRSDLLAKDTASLEAEKIFLNPASLQFLHYMIDNPVFSDSMAISPDQKNLLKILRDEYDEQKSLIEAESLTDQERGNQLHVLKKRFMVRINEVLLPFQQRQLLDLNYQSKGLPKLLTESPVGAILGLTDAQRENIRRESDKLAGEVYRFTHEARIRARDLLLAELTAEQKERLADVVGGDEKLNSYFEYRHQGKVFHDHLYDKKSDVYGGNPDPQVNRTILEPVQKDR